MQFTEEIQLSLLYMCVIVFLFFPLASFLIIKNNVGLKEKKSVQKRLLAEIAKEKIRVKCRGSTAFESHWKFIRYLQL